jgi:hypothetical protein
MDQLAIHACIQYDLKALEMVRIRCTSYDSNQFDTTCICPTLALDIQYDSLVN